MGKTIFTLLLGVAFVASAQNFVEEVTPPSWTTTKTAVTLVDFSPELAAATDQLKEKFDTGKTTKSDLQENLNSINNLIVKHIKDGNREQLARLYLLDAHIYADALNDTVKARAIWSQVTRGFPGTPAAKEASASIAQIEAKLGSQSGQNIQTSKANAQAMNQTSNSQRTTQLSFTNAFLPEQTSPAEDLILDPGIMDNKEVFPFGVTVVKSPKKIELNDISNQVAILFSAKEYDKLDTLAAKYRSSKEHYEDGHWKLNGVYDALNISQDAPDTEFESLINNLKDWIKVKPDSITAQVALADVFVSYAWKARGSGFADTVTDEGSRLFEQRLHQAADVLAQAKIVKEQCPRYWSVLMRVGLGLGVHKSQFDAVFSQAIQAEPDYEPYYELRANFLLPRWYGDEGEWQKDLTKSADKIGGENGDMLYAQVVWGMHHFFKNVITDNNLSWVRVDKGFETIEEHYPDSLAVKNERAHLAVLADDKPAARKYFIQTQGKIDTSAWNSSVQYLSFANYAYLVK